MSEGKPVDPEDTNAAIAKAQRLIAARERSSCELRKRLMDDGFSEGTADDVVSRCQRASLVDDTRFASLFIESKKRQGWGRNRILHELEHHGIESDSADALCPDFDEDQELERALGLLQTHHTSSKNPYRALYGYLIRRGFTSTVANRALRRHLDI